MKSLVIAEKPNQGLEYAKILNCNVKKDGYMEGDNYIVTWAVGHLIGLKEPHEHDEKYKTWKLEDLPLVFDIEHSLKVLSGAEKQFHIIKNLIHRDDVSQIINGGDAGREGELIQRWIYKMAGNKKQVRRLWVDDLTEKSIRDGFMHLKDSKEFDTLFEEGEARALLDQFLGYNYSRMLTLTKSKGLTLIYGRCQTPILNQVIERDKDIENFVATPYYLIKSNFQFQGGSCRGTYVDDKFKNVTILDKVEAEKIRDSLSKNCEVKLFEKKEVHKKAPLLYNITQLQKEMSSKYGYEPDDTLAVAQELYDKHKILSYPRTDSRYLSSNIKAEILDNLQVLQFGKFKDKVDYILEKSPVVIPESYFNDNKVTDHHALIPTANNTILQVYTTLSVKEKNVFDAVAYSLISIFLEDYVYDATSILIENGNYSFLCKGRTIKNIGWKAIVSTIENDSEDEGSVELPPLKIGEAGLTEDIEIENNKTKPKQHFTISTLLALMEANHIGTGATRAEIIKKLLSKTGKNPEAFILKDKNKLVASSFSKTFIKYIPENLKTLSVVSNIDEKLQLIEDGKLRKEDVIQEALQELKHNIVSLKENGPDNALVLENNSNSRLCPKCKRPVLYNKNKKFYYCKGYFDEAKKCNFSISGSVLGKSLTEKNIEDLLIKKKTSLIKGFISQKGSSFDAYLLLDEYGKIKFEFPKTKKRYK